MVWISRWQSRNRRHETWSPRVYRRQRWAQVRCLQSANICFRQWLGWEEMWKERESEEARERERASERDSQLLNYNISLIEKVFRFICNRFETVQFKLRVFVFVRERARARTRHMQTSRICVSVFSLSNGKLSKILFSLCIAAAGTQLMELFFSFRRTDSTEPTHCSKRKWSGCVEWSKTFCHLFLFLFHLFLRRQVVLVVRTSGEGIIHRISFHAHTLTRPIRPDSPNECSIEKKTVWPSTGEKKANHYNHRNSWRRSGALAMDEGSDRRREIVFFPLPFSSFGVCQRRFCTDQGYAMTTHTKILVHRK